MDTSGLVTESPQSEYLCYQEMAKLGHESPTHPGWVTEPFFAPKKMPTFNICGGLLKAINKRIVEGISEGMN